MKYHEIPGTGGVYNHISLLVVPTHQDYWADVPGTPFVHFFEGTTIRFATLGGGPIPLEVISACFGSALLVGEPNRPTDRTTPYTQLEKLPVAPYEEIAFIARLLQRDTNYDDDLDYECSPGPFTDGYNSNSYARGVLQAAQWPLPQFARGWRAFRFPGWYKPIPFPKFEP